jgi:Ca-activated chloride channel family protein
MKVLRILLPLALLTALVMATAPQPARTVTGHVTDPAGQPLPGVTVQVKTTRLGTLTDQRGFYQLRVPAGQHTLVFNSVGYVKKEIRLGRDSVVNVRLEEDRAALDEVVVTGYNSGAKRAQPAGVVGRTMFAAPMPSQAAGFTESEDYDRRPENGFHETTRQALTTFSIDVDRAAYSNVRRMLNGGQLPPPEAVRVEEFINYFDYDYPQPTGDAPVGVSTELADSPWNPGLKLLRVGLQARRIANDQLPPSNLVFLVDVSGSMMDANKLPLVKSALTLLADQLRPQDRVALVVYAGAAGLVLPSTSGSEKSKIKDAIAGLEAGGSTAGAEGIRLAYDVATKNFLKNGNNRVILATDGDFNVGTASDAELEKLIEEKRQTGVFLSVLGFGMGNLKDRKMETLADKGNGNYGYIDSFQEARKTFVYEFGGTLFTVAKDVKVQIEFNPARVRAYRLIGYENRMLANEDFHDDKKDAGEMGSGHTVTALYELVPAGVTSTYLKVVDSLKYQTTQPVAGVSGEWLTLKIRYKRPDAEKSQLLTEGVSLTAKSFERASENFRFAAAVAEFGLLLRNSEYRGGASFEHAAKTAKAALGTDEEGLRSEFVRLVKTAAALKGGATRVGE